MIIPTLKCWILELQVLWIKCFIEFNVSFVFNVTISFTLWLHFQGPWAGAVFYRLWHRVFIPDPISSVHSDDTSVSVFKQSAFWVWVGRLVPLLFPAILHACNTIFYVFNEWPPKTALILMSILGKNIKSNPKIVFSFRVHLFLVVSGMKKYLTTFAASTVYLMTYCINYAQFWNTCEMFSVVENKSYRFSSLGTTKISRWLCNYLLIKSNFKFYFYL